MKRCCVIVDNMYLYEALSSIIQKQKLNQKIEFYFFCSENNDIQESKKVGAGQLKKINLKSVRPSFHKGFDMFLSLHCKQIIPEYIVKESRCINIHPGFNPYNRGWYPQVFSIINKKPVGVTIHEMDAEIDHGPIIIRELVEIDDSDTSYDVYQKILKKEVELLEKYLEMLIEGNYKKQEIETGGNINYKKNFEEMCKIDMMKTATYGEVIDYLRAMTFQDYNNAYFIDKEGHRIYVKIQLTKSSWGGVNPDSDCNILKSDWLHIQGGKVA